MIKGKKTFYKPENATVERSYKITVDSAFIAKLNPTFLQIDIEGNDLELLLDILKRQCFPDVLVYEHHYQTQQNIISADKYIPSLGYSCIEHPSNPKMNLVYAKVDNLNI